MRRSRAIPRWKPFPVSSARATSAARAAKPHAERGESESLARLGISLLLPSNVIALLFLCEILPFLSALPAGRAALSSLAAAVRLTTQSEVAAIKRPTKRRKAL